MSFGITVTHLICMAYRLASYEEIHCIGLHCLSQGEEGSGLEVKIATLFLHDFPHKLCRGNLQIRKPTDFWNLLLSCRATMPALKCFLFFWGGPDGFGFHLQSFFFVFPSSLFSLLSFFFSPLSSTLHLLLIFVSLMYLILLMYSITQIIFHFIFTFWLLQFKLNPCKSYSIIELI